MGNYFTKWKYVPETSVPTPKPPLLKGMLYIALYDYIAVTADELSFKATDLLIVAVQPKETWWMAQDRQTLKRGYIPYNFVSEYTNSHKIEPGWADISRSESVHKLSLNHNITGTYVIRPCSDQKQLVLSIKCLNEDQTVVVKHHRINFKVMEYYIDSRRKFSSLKELISFYHKYNEILPCKLSNPLQYNKHVSIQFRDIEIKRNKIKILKSIGSGHFGDVFMAILFDTKVAVKLLKKDTGDSKLFLKEAKIMHQLHHRNIVELIGVCIYPSTEPLYIITEFMENGSLLDYMQKSKEGFITFNAMLIMLMQISDGMAYLEQKSYIHRDLRAANILVGGDYSVKVADFGLAGIVEDLYIYAEDDYQFPIRWVAEEALGTNRFTLKSDVWSFGILMSEIITLGDTPYKELKSREVTVKVKNGYRMKRPLTNKFKCPDKFYDIMDSCWKKHRERPSFQELYVIFKEWAYASDELSSQDSLNL